MAVDRVVSAPIARVPPHLRNCFNRVVKVPQRDLSAKDMIRLISKMRRAELRKNSCGRQLLSWVRDNQRLLGPAK